MSILVILAPVHNFHHKKCETQNFKIGSATEGDDIIFGKSMSQGTVVIDVKSGEIRSNPLQEMLCNGKSKWHMCSRPEVASDLISGRNVEGVELNLQGNVDDPMTSASFAFLPARTVHSGNIRS